jgi:hypothetical protein
VTSAQHGSADLSLLVRAWREPRELEGLSTLVRGSLEIMRPGERPCYWASVADLHETIDAVLAANFPSIRG